MSAITISANSGGGAVTLSAPNVAIGQTYTFPGAYPTVAGQVLSSDLTGTMSWITPSGGGSGTVTTLSIVAANGFAGTVATASTTPAITLSTSITGVLKGNGTAISAAIAGTDYSLPIRLDTNGTSTNLALAQANASIGATSITLTGDVVSLVKDGTIIGIPSDTTVYKASNATLSTGNTVLTITPALVVALSSGGQVTYQPITQSTFTDIVAGSNITLTKVGNQISIASSGGGGGGVTSLNSLSGALTIVAGSGITVTPSGSNITIASTGGGGSTPGGSTTQLQYNNAGSFGGIANATFDNSIVKLTQGTGTTIGNSQTISADLNNSNEYKITSIASNDSAADSGNGIYVAVGRYVSSGAAVILRSTNGGLNWQSISTPGANCTPGAVLCQGSGSSTFLIISQIAGNPAYRSSDGGVTWTAVGTGGYGSAAVYANGPVVTSSGHVSTNFGTSWTAPTWSGSTPSLDGSEIYAMVSVTGTNTAAQRPVIMFVPNEYVAYFLYPNSATPTTWASVDLSNLNPLRIPIISATVKYNDNVSLGGSYTLATIKVLSSDVYNSTSYLTTSYPIGTIYINNTGSMTFNVWDFDTQKQATYAGYTNVIYPGTEFLGSSANTTANRQGFVILGGTDVENLTYRSPLINYDYSNTFNPTNYPATANALSRSQVTASVYNSSDNVIVAMGWGSSNGASAFTANATLLSFRSVAATTGSLNTNLAGKLTFADSNPTYSSNNHFTDNSIVGVNNLGNPLWIPHPASITADYQFSINPGAIFLGYTTSTISAGSVINVTKSGSAAIYICSDPTPSSSTFIAVPTGSYKSLGSLNIVNSLTTNRLPNLFVYLGPIAA